MVFRHPSEKWWNSSIGMMKFPRYGKIRVLFQSTSQDSQDMLGQNHRWKSDSPGLSLFFLICRSVRSWESSQTCCLSQEAQLCRMLRIVVYTWRFPKIWASQTTGFNHKFWMILGYPLTSLNSKQRDIQRFPCETLAFPGWFSSIGELCCSNQARQWKIHSSLV